MSAPWPALSPRLRSVTTEDGVALHVEEHGPDDADGTVVLVHGYELDGRLWARQVAALLQERPDLRLLTYDHRGHGRSGATPRERASIAQLGRDLERVLASLPDGPVVVVGHSMGGMTAIALAEQFPELVGERVVGVGLLGSSAAGSDALPGLPPRMAKVALQVVPRFNALAAAMEARGKQRLPAPGMRWLLFGDRPDRSDVLRTELALAECPASTCEAFFHAFAEHDRIAALEHFRGIPALIAVGDKDRLAPPSLSQAMHDELPQAQYVVYPGCGHMVMLERSEDLNRRLLALVRSALPVGQRTA